MAKFRISVTRTVQRSEVYLVHVLRDEVVEDLGLEGEMRRDWRDYVEDYLNANPPDYDSLEREDDGGTEDEFGEPEIDSVEEA